MALEQLEYDHREFDSKAAEADQALAVKFFTMPVKDEEKSAAEGRPIYKDTVMVEIRVRGDRNNVVHKPADDLLKRRFRDAWRYYEQGIELVADGTPLGEWPSMTRSQVEEMKFFGFFTVEHIANCREDLLVKFPGLTSLKQKARAFLELAQGNAPLEKMQTQLDVSKSENEALAAQVADMGRRMAEMEKKNQA